MSGGKGNSTARWYPGQIWPAADKLVLLEERESKELAVTNSGDRPIQVGSHFHFFEVNRALDFDRSAAYGTRLGIPPGTAVRFEPGQTQQVLLVEIDGLREIYGFNNLVDGPLDAEGAAEKAIARARELGFKGA